MRLQSGPWSGLHHRPKHLPELSPLRHLVYLLTAAMPALGSEPSLLALCSAAMPQGRKRAFCGKLGHKGACLACGGCRSPLTGPPFLPHLPFCSQLAFMVLTALPFPALHGVPGLCRYERQHPHQCGGAVWRVGVVLCGPGPALPGLLSTHVLWRREVAPETRPLLCLTAPADVARLGTQAETAWLPRGDSPWILAPPGPVPWAES